MTENELYLLHELRSERSKKINIMFGSLILALILAWSGASVLNANAETIPAAPITNIGRIIIPESTTLQLECESGFVVSTPEPSIVIVSCHRARETE